MYATGCPSFFGQDYRILVSVLAERNAPQKDRQWQGTLSACDQYKSLRMRQLRTLHSFCKMSRNSNSADHERGTLVGWKRGEVC